MVLDDLKEFFLKFINSPLVWFYRCKKSGQMSSRRETTDSHEKRPIDGPKMLRSQCNMRAAFRSASRRTILCPLWAARFLHTNLLFSKGNPTLHDNKHHISSTNSYLFNFEFRWNKVNSASQIFKFDLFVKRVPLPSIKGFMVQNIQFC